MQSSPETLSIPSELRGALMGLMKGATFSEEPLKEGCLPLVLMLREHALVAFAIGDQDDYLPQYEAFKKHYLKRSAEWSTKDLSFVYCLPDGITVEPDFCSRVEVDVYFCRKYVVRLDGDIEGNLARLPFLPLSPITPGVQTRPPSAQTLLRQRNLEADLAKALVVPSRSSPAAILNSCLAGTYGPPDALSSGASPSVSTDGVDERAQATLKSISIQNFRAYRTKKEFALGSAVTVLYGPNGFGKTSFFDALDFAVTGGIGRLSSAGGGLVKLAKHLDSKDQPTEVSLTLIREGREHVITRNLADHNNAQVDGKTTSRKEVLSLLTGGASPSADRVDSLVDLFRATHLFSQENQELTQSVASKCELSSDLVSRMLAFEDYASGLRKAGEVLKLAGVEHGKAAADVKNAQQAIADERKELQRLEGLAASDTSAEALNTRFASLEEAIAREGFDASEIGARDTRALRAMLDSAAAEAIARRDGLSRAVVQVGTLRALRGQSEAAQNRLAECQTQLRQAESSESAASELLGTLSSHLAQLKTQELGLQHRRDWFAWAVSVQPEFEQVTNQSQRLASSLSALTQQVSQRRAVWEQAQTAQREAAASVERAESALRTASEWRTRVQAVKELSTQWDQAAPGYIALQASEAQSRSTIELLREQLGEAQQAVLSKELAVARANRELEEARSSDTKLKELIAELRTRVDGPSCLLCGHDHGTPDALLAAIDQRLEQGDRLVQLSEAASKERAALQTLIDQRQSLAGREKQEVQQLGQVQTRRSELEKQRATFEASLNSVGMPLSGTALQQLESVHAKALEGESQSTNAVGAARQVLGTCETTRASAQASCQAVEQQRKAAESELNTAQRRSAELLAEAARGAVDIASGLQALSRAHRDTEEQRASTSSAAQSANEQVDGQKAAVAAGKAMVSAARTSHQQASQAWTALLASIQSVTASLTAAGFDSAVTEEELRLQIEVAAAREASAAGLRDRVAELEVAVDTAATSAAFQSLRERIQANQRLEEEATAHAQKLHSWVAYFTEVTKVLATQQAFATEHFITEYGPRTAVIQQRLRPVYGFGEVEVTSKDAAIGIRVHRKGEVLRPPDYFSQSQVQTLVLGLFLTACSSQTWSGFSSIMMDDPVTHFDDLNTYALLDLILGMQNSPEGERQFVISTCDEKLLQLARHKFRHMGAAAKFYRFQAIGAEGPMVSEIAA